jgi:hypothetical protein
MSIQQKILVQAKAIGYKNSGSEMPVFLNRELTA